MKLYTVPLSNFGNKSVIAMYEKGLPVEMTPPPGEGTKSVEYRAINPLGKIPCLEIDGTVVAESEVINEFLEDNFPSPPLLPKDAAARARVRFFTRLHDLYLDPPLRFLFGQVDPKTRSPKEIKAKLEEVQATLDLLESRIGTPWAAGEAFTLADCALPPTIWYVEKMLPMFGIREPFAERPKIHSWFRRAEERPSVKRALEAQGKALAAMMGGGK
jgi:glutathione S-transferase